VVDRPKPLGSLKPFGSSVTRISAQASTRAGSHMISKYSAQCEFQNGKGEAELELIKRKEEWRIQRFHVRRE
jgi:hypothetical protein